MSQDRWVTILASEWDIWWKTDGRDITLYHCTEDKIVKKEKMSSFLGYLEYGRCQHCATTWPQSFDPKDHGIALWKLRTQVARELRYKLVEVEVRKVRYTKLVEVK